MAPQSTKQYGERLLLAHRMRRNSVCHGVELNDLPDLATVHYSRPLLAAHRRITHIETKVDTIERHIGLR